MPKVIVLATIKGGAGKSALTQAIGVEFQLRGRRTCVVCLDVGQRSTHKWGDRRKELGVPLEMRPFVLALDDDTFAEHFAGQIASFDVVVVDMPGKLSDQLIRVVERADLVLVPTTPENSSIESLDETLPKIKQSRKTLRRQGRELDVAILITKKRKNTVSARVARKRCEEVPDVDVLETELHLSEDFDHATGAGVGPTAFNPAGEAAREVRHLVDELDKRLALPAVVVSIGAKKKGAASA